MGQQNIIRLRNCLFVLIFTILGQISPITQAFVRTNLLRLKKCPYGSPSRCMPYMAAEGFGKTIEGVSVVLLAGGAGKRMKADRPKQFLQLLDKPVLLHSLDIFSTLPGVSRIVIVLEEIYREEYRYLQREDSRIVFADPGRERQDSVFNGFMQTLPDASVVCIHDSARPLVSQQAVLLSIADGYKHGAAVLGVPMKATVKESEDGQFVLRTIARSRLWEIQTPQVITPQILQEAFTYVKEKNVDVTDDVSMVEQIGHRVKLTMGEYTNIKLTTPEDLHVAAEFLRQRSAVLNRAIEKRAEPIAG